MSRVQLALNVDDLDAAVDFYRRLFDTPPAKRHHNYANFAIAEPPLKLVLMTGDGDGGTLNHLGVEVASTDDVTAAGDRLARQQLVTREEQGTICCYAEQDKVWVTDPDGAPWEVYTVLADSEIEHDGRATPCDDASDAHAAGCC